MQDSHFISDSFAFDSNVTPRKEGLTDKLRQKINVGGARKQAAREAQISTPNLTNLTTRSQVRRHRINSIFSCNYFV